jgi:hypothetical protein
MSRVDAVLLTRFETAHRKLSEQSTASNALDDDVGFSVCCAGSSMHPQIIMDEVSFVLKGLAKLVLHPLTAMHLSLPVRRSEVRPDQNQHEQEFRSRSSSSTFQNVKPQTHLNSERAHLFLLYRNFCELLTTRYDHHSLNTLRLIFCSTGHPFRNPMI